MSAGNSPAVQLTPAVETALAAETVKTIQVPGSKSYTIRALLLAALTPGTVTLLNPLDSDDTQAMKACLKTLGIAVLESEGQWQVKGSVADVAVAQYTLNTNLSAASIRFLIALATILPGEKILLGEHGLNQRPVKDLVDSLRVLGADIVYEERDGYPPVRVKSSTLQTDRNLKVSGKTSSQYVSALMMIAPALAEQSGCDIVIELIDELISKPYLEMTRAIMGDFGVTVAADEKHYRIASTARYQTEQYAVETDASSMAYSLAIAALSRRTLTIENVNPQSVQADMALLKILECMGNRITFEKGGVTIEGLGVKALNLNMEDCPDQAQTVAVLAAFAEGTTRIEGLQSLRVKETDRLSAVATELTKMGVTVREEADAIEIDGQGLNGPKAASIHTYGDHRMGMAFAVAGSVLPDLIIEDHAVVGKTYPTFWKHLETLGIGVKTLALCTTQNGANQG